MSTSVAEPQTPDLAARVAPYVTCLLILLALIDSQVVAAIAPQIADGIGASESTVTGSVTVYSIFAAAVALGLAWSPRGLAPKTWLPAAAMTFAIASALTAAATMPAVFFVGRALTGFSGGLISALAIAALANASSYERRGSQMGLVAVSYFLAPVLGVPLGTLITGQFGWRTTFVLSAVGVAIAGVLVRSFPLADVAAPPVAAAADDARSKRGLASLWRLANRSKSTRLGIVSAFFVSGGLVGFTTFLGTWLHDAFAAGPRSVSLVYAIAGVSAVAGGAIGGKLADRFGKLRVAVVGSLWLAFLLPSVPTFAWGPLLMVSIALTAFAASVRVAPLQALITEVVSAEERPTYVALRNASSQIGIATAVAACGGIYDRMGLIGVGLVCAAATFVAWLTSRWIDDPGVVRDGAAPRRKRSFLRWARYAVTSVLLLLLFLTWALSFLVTKAWTRPDELNRPETPATYQAVYEDVEFTSSDGNTLSGWYLPSTGRGVTIVMTHGLFRSRYELIQRGCDLWKQGYGVLLYDVRRHGKSKGEFATIGYKERHDVEGAVAFVREKAPSDRIVLFGVSMGAAATLLAAAETDGISAVVADSSFLSLKHTVYHHLSLTRIPVYPFAPVLVTLTAARMNFAPSSFDVLAAVRKIQIPIMFIGGSKDVRMPIDTVLDPLYEAAPNPAKRRMVVDGASHGHAYDEGPEAYVAAVTDFLQASGL